MRICISKRQYPDFRPEECRLNINHSRELKKQTDIGSADSIRRPGILSDAFSKLLTLDM